MLYSGQGGALYRTPWCLNCGIFNSNFKKEYDDLEPEYDIINAMIKVRKEKGLTQKQLSELTGISQADISRIENGTRNPSLEMIKRLATGMGMRLKLEFIPVSKVED